MSRWVQLAGGAIVCAVLAVVSIGAFGLTWGWWGAIRLRELPGTYRAELDSGAQTLTLTEDARFTLEPARAPVNSSRGRWTFNPEYGFIAFVYDESEQRPEKFFLLWVERKDGRISISSGGGRLYVRQPRP